MKKRRFKAITLSLLLFANGAYLPFALASSLVAQPAPGAAAPKEGKSEPTGKTDGSTDGKGESAGKKEAPARKREGVWTLISKGGLTMIPLGLITTIIIAFGLERAFYFRRQKVTTKGYFRRIETVLDDGGVPAVEKHLAEDDLLLSRILSKAMDRKGEGIASMEKALELNASVEIGNLERGLNLLSNMGNLAPLLGFFGTVVGMRASFLQFVEKAAPTAQDLASGVEEALITTAAGLLIAIPTYLMYNVFIYYIDSLTIELERSATAIINRMRA